MKENSALAAIRTRAKQLRGKNKNLGWIAAIKKASKELKAEGKVGAAKKAVPKQRGKSNLKRDKQRKAMPPGKRTVKHGKKKNTVYYETRKNRSDKPGSLTGMDMYTHRDRIERQIKHTIDIIEWFKKSSVPVSEKREAIARNKKYLASLKKQLREQNSHISKSLK